MKTMIFGVFDNFHKGHIYFVEESMKHGENLVIVVACDAVVREIKGRPPKWHELKRLELLVGRYPSATVVLGDQAQSSYDVIKKHQPDLICLGYDQQALKADLEAKMLSGVIPKMPMIEIKAHKPEEYKSSLYA